jgi:hypothetical protein
MAAETVFSIKRVLYEERNFSAQNVSGLGEPLQVSLALPPSLVIGGQSAVPVQSIKTNYSTSSRTRHR